MSFKAVPIAASGAEETMRSHSLQVSAATAEGEHVVTLSLGDRVFTMSDRAEVEQVVKLLREMADAVFAKGDA